jgi:hypothetical protein
VRSASGISTHASSENETTDNRTVFAGPGRPETFLNSSTSVRLNSECLGHLVLGLLRVADHGEHRPQAGIPAGLEELGELRLLLAHTRLTPCAPTLLTCDPENSRLINRARKPDLRAATCFTALAADRSELAIWPRQFSAAAVGRCSATAMHADSLRRITMGPGQRTTFGMCGNWIRSTNECLISARWSRSFPGATKAHVTMAGGPGHPQ